MNTLVRLSQRQFAVALALLSALAGPACAADSAPAPATSPITLVGSLGAREAFVFEGNKTFSSDTIMDELRRHMDFFLATHPAAPLGELAPQIAKLVQVGYRHRGFPEAQVDATLDSTAGRLRVAISEGPRYKTGAIRFTGVKEIQEPSVQSRLMDALAGLPTPAVATLETNQLEAFWEKDGYPPFDEGATASIVTRLEAELETLNYYRPKLNVTVVPNASSKTADLQVEMADAGLKGTIEQIELNYRTADRKNSRQEILSFLGLETGQPVTASLLTDVTNRLWRSARFLEHTATLTPLPEVGKFRLDLGLRDLEEALPLSQPLSTNEMMMLKLSDWLAQLTTNAEDLVFSWTAGLPETDLAGDLVLSHSGLASVVRRKETGGTTRLVHGFALSDKEAAWYSGWREQKLLSGGGCGIAAFVTILPNPTATGKNRFWFTAGGGFKGGGDQAATVSLTFQFCPAQFMVAAHKEDATYTLTNGQFIASLPSEFGSAATLKIDAQTGRLLQLSGAFKTNNVRFAMDLHFATGAYSRAAADLAKSGKSFPNVLIPEAPVSSWLGAIVSDAFESRMLESAVLTNYLANTLGWQTNGLPSAEAQTIRTALEQLKSALGQQDLAACLAPLEKKVRAWQASRTTPQADSTDSFTIPRSPIDVRAFGSGFMGVAGWFIIQQSDTIWPRDSWPWVLTREAGFTMTGLSKYTSGELQKLLASDRTGPLGCWAAAMLLARMDAPLAEKFVRRGIERNSPTGLHADLEAVLATNTAAGQISEGALAELDRISDADLQKLAALFLPHSTNLVRELAQALRTRSGQSTADILQPAIERNWNAQVSPAVSALLTNLLLKVGAPQDAEGAYQRAQFIMSSAQNVETVREAMKFFQVAAEKGHGLAQLNLGALYGGGKIGPADYATALKWFTLAAKQNVPHAACRVGDYYFYGRGVTADKEEAVKWFEQEAKNQCGHAEYMLGQCAEAASKNEEALNWYRQAGTNGFVEAQSALGYRLSEGLLCQPNYPEAFLWFTTAQLGGDRVAGASARGIKSHLDAAQIKALEKEAARLVEVTQQKNAEK